MVARIDIAATRAVLPAKNGNGALHNRTKRNMARIALDYQSVLSLKLSKMLGITFSCPKYKIDETLSAR